MFSFLVVSHIANHLVDFDTGSSDLFLPGPSCSTNCAGHTKYTPSSSSTAVDLKKTFALKYGDGSTVSGEQYTDTVSIAGLTVRGSHPPVVTEIKR